VEPGFRISVIVFPEGRGSHNGLVASSLTTIHNHLVLECAVVANANLIISGDKDLLALGEYEGIRILTPRAFLEEFAT
jgi:hypothetical protein